MSGGNGDPKPTLTDSRLVSLEERLSQAEAAEAERVAVTASPEASADYRLGSKVLADLLGGMIGGSLIGWLIDRVAGTEPWGLLGMLFVGIAVAFRNIIRLTRRTP